jgi:nitroreductase
VSIRRYKRAPIPEEHVRAIMEAARRAPTDAALHLWTAIRVKDQGIRARIAEAIGQQHVYDAAEFFVFVADLYRLERLLEYRGEKMGDVDIALLLFAAVDAGIAAENMAVAAESLGYGTCFIGGVQSAPRQVIEALKLPPRTYPLFGLTVGIPDEKPEKRPRMPLNVLFHEDEYRDYDQETLEEIFNVMAPITRRRDYLRLVKRYVGVGGYFEARNRMLPCILKEMGFSLEGFMVECE